MKTRIVAKDFPVVCVGGSAGGLDAYIRGSVSDRVGNSSSITRLQYLPQPQHLVMKGGAGRWASLPATM